MDYEIPDTTDDLPEAEKFVYQGAPGGGFSPVREPKVAAQSYKPEVIEFGVPSPERVFSPPPAPMPPPPLGVAKAQTPPAPRPVENLPPVPVGRPTARIEAVEYGSAPAPCTAEFFLPGFGVLSTGYRNVVVKDGYAVLAATRGDTGVYFPTGENPQRMRYDGQEYWVVACGILFDLDTQTVCIVQLLPEPGHARGRDDGEEGGDLAGDAAAG